MKLYELVLVYVFPTEIWDETIGDFVAAEVNNVCPDNCTRRDLVKI